jgi:hypothetical protein
MKKQIALIAISVIALTTNASFALIASDNSGNYSGSFIGQDKGTGFQAWTSSVSGSGGSYIGATGQSASSFGIYAGGGSGNSFSAYRAFESTMSVGDTFSINLGTTAVPTGEVGINLYSGGNFRLGFKRAAGQTFWALNDGSSDFNTNIAWAASTSLNYSFTRGAGNVYSIVITQGVTTYTGSNYTSTSGTMAIDEFQVYSSAQGAGENVGFNNMGVVPEPATWALLAAGLTTVMVFRRRRIS